MYGFICCFQTFRHELFFDKDTIIHIEQKNTNFCCHVYKLKATRGKVAEKWIKLLQRFCK